MQTDDGISDHALVRYLERVHGIDFAPHRADLAAIVAPALKAGAASIYRNGFTYLLQGGTLVTVVTGRQRFISRQDAYTRRLIAAGEYRA